jgi:hypothetical protein
MTSGSFIKQHGLVQYTERLGRRYPREGRCELGLCRLRFAREREGFEDAQRRLAELEHRAPFDAKTIRLRTGLLGWQASLDRGPRIGRRNSLVFDHCHQHGWVRGLICMGCNNDLALFEPEPRSEWAAQASGALLALVTAYRAHCPDCHALGGAGEL